ncbi:MAG: hypothetical protein CME61_08740 [Halobacteriovoraceae bacterium]|nr:hypothetical protein [Halobacteriovoraceae bacterium]|tara:strand:+ start:1563 stop:1811 length:249 start_codon:yes stop_codon:yes gene_type:complete
MKITDDSDCLLFDDQHPKCNLIVAETQGQLFAFVTCLDLGLPHNRLTAPHQKRYWGKFDWAQQEASIREIMHNGSKWPELPQ